MNGEHALLRRGTQVLWADPRRVVTKLFLPGQEVLIRGVSRADPVIERILAMTESDVAGTLAATVAQFADRHRNVRAIFAEHYAAIAHRVPQAAALSPARQSLIGACFTQEYSVEAAALFNPSIVAHPDQSGLASDELRFIMSVRAVGEGHVSSIEFRTGVIGGADNIRVDAPGPHLVTGRVQQTAMSREFLRRALAERVDAARSAYLLSLLPPQFSTADLDAAIARVRQEKLTRRNAEAVIEQVRWVISCNYQVSFPDDHALSERVLFPTGPDESRGLEDARFTRFVGDDAAVTYRATYTAFDGSAVSPHLLTTRDFQSFEVTQLVGPAATNKGMALFPRQVNGNYLMLSRWDRENIGLATSRDLTEWGAAVTIRTPTHPWEIIQLGNCGSPIETREGWIVLTHGVGPMRSYGIGAILLDLHDPSRVIGALTEPLLAPNEAERDGYVPNVVYSCGALIHDQTLVLPYGCSDSSIRFAFVDVPELLGGLLAKS